MLPRKRRGSRYSSKGEEAVLEYLKGEGWTGLEIHNNEILPPPEGERGILWLGPW